MEFVATVGVLLLLAASCLFFGFRLKKVVARVLLVILAGLCLAYIFVLAFNVGNTDGGTRVPPKSSTNQGVSAEESAPEWPALAMKYEATGKFHAVGENSPVTSTIGFKLTHQANGDWKEEIVSAPDISTRLGVFNRTGSYQSVTGNTYTRYDVESGTTETEVIPEGHIRSPRAMIYPMPLAKLDEHYTGTRQLVSTTAKVCFQAVCENSALGWMYEMSNGNKYVLADDKRGIPISLGHLNITEVTVSSNKVPAPR